MAQTESITVTDSKTGASNAVFIAPAGLLVTAQIAIESLMTARHAITLAANPAGQYVVTDAAGEGLARYDASADVGRAAAERAVASASFPLAATAKQLAYLAQLVAQPPYELRNYAARIRKSVGPQMTRVEASKHISVLTWRDDP